MMIIDEDKISPYKKLVQHANDRQGNCESCVCEAYQLDDENGVCFDFLKFPVGMFNKVDYFSIIDKRVIFLELTDLDEQLKNIAISVAKIKNSNSATKKQEIKDAWFPVIHEFHLKWVGSIAAIERLQKKHGIIDDPDYELIIVCKNNTDVIMLENLCERLTGKISVCKAIESKKLANFINLETN